MGDFPVLSVVSLEILSCNSSAAISQPVVGCTSGYRPGSRKVQSRRIGFIIGSELIVHMSMELSLDYLTSQLIGQIRDATNYAGINGTMRSIVARLVDSPYVPPIIWHPTGFLTIEIARTLEPSLARIHIWPSGKRPVQVTGWPIHAHSWRFASHTLCGTVIDNTYTVTPEDEGAERLYEATFSSGANRIIATETRVSCRLIASVEYPAGTAHYIPRGTYHATKVNPGTFAATVVLMTEPSHETPYVIGKATGRTAYRKRHIQCGRSTYNALIKQLQQNLDANPL